MGPKQGFVMDTKLDQYLKMSGSNKCNFSIDHILNEAGKPQITQNGSTHPVENFDWLNCTRYRPPRLPRNGKREGIQRRNAGRNPRIPFSPAQVALLEGKFQQTPYLSSLEINQLATTLHLSETRIKIWFQNRRARERREKDAASMGLLGREKTGNAKTHQNVNLPVRQDSESDRKPAKRSSGREKDSGKSLLMSHQILTLIFDKQQKISASQF